MRPSNLQLRLATAAVGLPAVVALIYTGEWPLALAAGVIALLAAAEFVHGWLIPSRPIREVAPQATVFAASAAVVVGVHADVRFAWAGLALAAVLLVAGYLPVNLFGPRRPLRVHGWCILYIGILFSALVLTRDLERGRKWVFLGILGTFAVDTGAYAVGKLIGRHLMAPKISPKKTWEGAVGGYVAGVAAVFAMNALFDTGVSAMTISHFAIAMPLFAEVGDLFESRMKRLMGVKDASGLLPGHGGFLDRLDSVLFVMPLLWVFLQVRVL